MDIKPFISCMHPQRIFNRNTKSWEYVPCGKCPACINRANAQLAARIQKEIEAHKYTLFFTLTYDNEHIPLMEYFEDKCSHAQFRPFGRVASDDRYFKSLPFLPFWDYSAPNSKFNPAGVTGCEVNLPLPPVTHYDGKNTVFAVCCKQDVIDFVKRLRQKIYKNYGNSAPIKYYFCSEYGPRTFRPHYHGLLFFDSPALREKIVSFIVQSWGLFRRLQGHGRNRFSFEPFCDAARFTVEGNGCEKDFNISFVTPTTNSAANYVSQYVSSDSDLPQVLQFKAFKPFRLYSAGSMFGVTAALSTEVFTHFAHLYELRNCFVPSVKRDFTHPVQIIDKQGYPVSLAVPYTEHELLSVWRKPFEYSLLSDNQKSSTYRFISRYYDELSKKMIPRRKWRSYLLEHHKLEYLGLSMDNDSNWIASTRAFQFCHPRGIDVDYYFKVYEYTLYLSQQYKLKCFYQLQNRYLSNSLPLRSLLSAYPFVFEGLPSVLTREDFLSNKDVAFCLSLGIDLAELYPDDRHLDTRFVESLNQSHSPVYASWQADELKRAFQHNKSKFKESCLTV